MLLYLGWGGQAGPLDFGVGVHLGCVHVPSNGGEDGLPENVRYLPTVCWMELPENVGYPLRLSGHPKFGLL